MNVYTVTMSHPDGSGWDTHAREHVLYLKGLINAGKIIASGPIKGAALRSGFILFRARDISEVKAMVEADPFSREGLIASLEIAQWDPLFGQLSAYSSGTAPENLQDLAG